MTFVIKEIKPQFDLEIGEIIRIVGQEFGAIGDGFGPSDSEVSAMSRNYRDENGSRYLVAIVDNKIVGGSGIAAFNGSNEICELRKLFILSESRGLGLGQKLVEGCINYARSKGYTKCYLDTLANMESAIALYGKLGFEHLDKPLQGTIHNGCDVWMLKEL
ncbi:GNAT family N-acetyltransferase [Psychromonas antarctica]|uniref:GNAT family N-acetyltransferase n=1 Tax=Psychromonas antarctica TaxID=67573 RepID=UPI001EE849B6|nr:GNAT family N-acetyltransferase [Psychromonas antarctica]